MEHARKARQFCLTLAAVLTGVLVMAPAQGHGKARPPQPQWEWQVAVGGAGLNLVGDGGGDYTDTGNDLVRVYKDTRNKYRFRLHIWNGSARHIKLQYVAFPLGLSSLCYDPGPGYFPVGSCGSPDPMFCSECTPPFDFRACQERFQGFLNGLHPRCGYESIFLEVTVPLDIESMPVVGLGGEAVQVNGHVELYDRNTSDILKDPAQALHNMDAQSIPANEAPLWVRRTAANSWQVGVSEASGYMSYCEFYWGIFRGRLPENKIPMCANGPLTFETTWTRELVN